VAPWSAKKSYGIKGKPSDLRASEEGQMANWILAMTSQVPRGSLPYFYARFQSPNHMTLELRDMESHAQRMNCLQAIHGIGKKVAEVLISKICPDQSSLLMERPADKEYRRKLLEQMPRLKKTFSEDKLFPLGEHWTPSFESIRMLPQEQEKEASKKKKRKEVEVKEEPVAAYQVPYKIPKDLLKSATKKKKPKNEEKPPHPPVVEKLMSFMDDEELIKENNEMFVDGFLAEE
jgi:hypothetical protein